MALAFVLGVDVCRGQPYEEYGKKHSWFSFSRPAEKSPAAQLEHAQRLLDAGRYKKAQRAFYSLAITWPSSPEAPMAQWAYARILDQRGKKEDAFEAYQTLMTKYPGRFPDYDEILARQFEIAKALITQKRGRLFFGGFEAPERAIPFLESVIKNGPRSVHAPEAQYFIGYAYEQNYEYEMAVVAYIAAQHRYPFSPFAEKAAFGRARSLYKLSTDRPNDQRALEEAWAGVMVFLRAFPQSEFAGEAEGMRDRLLTARARSAFNIARFYDKIARRPDAAKISYEQFIQLYPASPWTPKARERIDVLATQPTPAEESPDHE